MVLNKTPNPTVSFSAEKARRLMRDAKDMTQSQLARKLGVSRQRISQMLLEQERITPKLEGELEVALGVESGVMRDGI